CVQCLVPSDCPNPAGFPCVVATCTAQHTCGTANAPATTTCSFGGGKLCDGAGACVECLAPTDCANPAGYPCVVPDCTSQHACGGSNAPVDTPCGGGTCSAGVAQLVDKCDGAGTCVDNGTADCGAYTCASTACNTSCTDDTTCSVGNTCDTGITTCTNGPKC